MVVSYADSDRAQELGERARQFVDEQVIPVERDHLGEGPVSESVIDDLQQTARDYGVYCPQIPEEYGGMGEDLRDVLPLFEAAGRSLLGPTVMRVAAPDEGNMHTLELVGTDEQKERWLEPLVAGEIDSGFAMTEPMQGAGSDPKMLQTTAERDGDDWVLDGHKWWTTGGVDADLYLVMARTDLDAHPYEGSSILLVPADTDGVEIVRDIPHMGQDLVPENHAEIRFDGVRVPAENLLGAPGAGFAIAQQRLGPARLTHCMRFSGMAERALDIATAYTSEREAFGESLDEKQALRFEVADAEIELHAARSMVRHAAEKLARGEQARTEVAMAKVYAANTAQDVIDFAVQACGANGIGKDLPLADFYQAVRAFRIVDGADEVHRRSVAREAFAAVDPSEVEHVTRF
ncbi:acyl-CoA dehydrogenase family protein [Halapricum salinum]|uniref:Acyl-CoA dehydrogenase n=1 Tax=Halapricum salinum TaxID=1457250 RepID=A0A4D6HD45_9EURY|nr:acyl-CoA dehydrogenase family protein [Halapricum salinum]QCC51903.1 acyl-CoA dehydrogenase [Halapricum salinum]